MWRRYSLSIYPHQEYYTVEYWTLRPGMGPVTEEDKQHKSATVLASGYDDAVDKADPGRWYRVTGVRKHY